MSLGSPKEGGCSSEEAPERKSPQLGLHNHLFPAEIQATTEIDTLPGLEDYVGEDKPIRIPGPFVAAQIQSTTGQVIIEQDQIALLTEWTIGKGFIDFIALDPAAAPFDCLEWDSIILAKFTRPQRGLSGMAANRCLIPATIRQQYALCFIQPADARVAICQLACAHVRGIILLS